MKINLGVMFGGPSTEHEISVISALQAINNLNKDKYNVVPIYISKDAKFYTSSKLLDMKAFKNINNIGNIASEVNLVKRNNEFVLVKNKFPYGKVSKIDIVLPVLHGYNTEDGNIAGFLETIGIPYCESDIYASVIGQDKVMQKQVLKDNGINVLDYVYFYDYEYTSDADKVLKNIESNIKYPVIIKPARQGSSIGISIAGNKDELIKSIEDAILYDSKILVEKALSDFTELNCSVLKINDEYKTSPIEKVYGSDEILSFKDKYMSSGSKSSGSKGMASAGREVPAKISETVARKICEMSIKACYALDTNGVVRIDYMYDKKTKKVYLNEMNIIPGSLSFYLWKAEGMEYKELLDNIIDSGISRYNQKHKKTSSFETNVLSNFSGTKGVKK